MINIQDIAPFIKKGWVAYDNTGWWWFPKKPFIKGDEWFFIGNGEAIDINVVFDIAPADDWTKSLIKVGGK